MFTQDLGGHRGLRSSHRARYEHRALHGVSRAWPTAGHAAGVAGDVAVRLSEADLLSAIVHC